MVSQDVLEKRIAHYTNLPKCSRCKFGIEKKAIIVKRRIIMKDKKVTKKAWLCEITGRTNFQKNCSMYGYAYGCTNYEVDTEKLKHFENLGGQ
jgi:hypothetical protein